MSYQSIRNQIMKNETLFSVVRFFFTPIRLTKEYIYRRKKANELISKYENLSSEKSKIFYFGIPEHNNLGDIAQTYCTRKWLSLSFPEHYIIEARTRVTFDRKFDNFLKRNLGDNDFIVFQSGYCTRHKNPDHLMHLHIAKRFPNIKMIILPQTVNLNDEKDINSTRTVFEKCSRFIFVTRDRLSFEYAKKFVSEENLFCYPDIVTSLIGRVDVKSVRNGCLLCVRNDDEKYYSDKDLSDLQHRLEETYEKVDRTDTNSTKTADEVFENLENEVVEKITQFASYECIITDRYHGTIFSLIANTPVIVIKTNDHKVTSALEWFRGCYDNDSVQLAEDLDIALKKARKLRESNVTVNNGDILYKKYYDSSLRELINSK